MIEDQVYREASVAVSETVAPNFNLQEEFAKRSGPFIEVAGPTESGFRLIDVDTLPQKLFVSNIHFGAPRYDDDTGELLGYFGTVDFVADAKKLPFANGSLGALFARCLDYTLYESFLSEASRVLESGGIVCLENISVNHFLLRDEYRLKLQIFQSVEINPTSMEHNVLLQKM